MRMPLPCTTAWLTSMASRGVRSIWPGCHGSVIPSARRPRSRATATVELVDHLSWSSRAPTSRPGSAPAGRGTASTANSTTIQRQRRIPRLQRRPLCNGLPHRFRTEPGWLRQANDELDGAVLVRASELIADAVHECERRPVPVRDQRAEAEDALLARQRPELGEQLPARRRGPATRRRPRRRSRPRAHPRRGRSAPARRCGRWPGRPRRRLRARSSRRRRASRRHARGGAASSRGSAAGGSARRGRRRRRAPASARRGGAV